MRGSGFGKGRALGWFLPSFVQKSNPQGLGPQKTLQTRVQLHAHTPRCGPAALCCNMKLLGCIAPRGRCLGPRCRGAACLPGQHCGSGTAALAQRGQPPGEPPEASCQPCQPSSAALHHWGRDPPGRGGLVRAAGAQGTATTSCFFQHWRLERLCRAWRRRRQSRARLIPHKLWCWAPPALPSPPPPAQPGGDMQRNPLMGGKNRGPRGAGCCWRGSGGHCGHLEDARASPGAVCSFPPRWESRAGAWKRAWEGGQLGREGEGCCLRGEQGWGQHDAWFDVGRVVPTRRNLLCWPSPREQAPPCLQAPSRGGSPYRNHSRDQKFLSHPCSGVSGRSAGPSSSDTFTALCSVPSRHIVN